ncbi:pyrroline-5-carboxylate reductase [Actinospica durhamensis]|uniref:Pyrroline-5-carboxylate reductase n=1 Tax=Actinospica durhamensis TaxID=1508375 RepID=A0A941IP41_9ACTN|nr:pyrroline-5-carboxylate reductase [Actinospica durhamensis]MBR7836130.1 pyrroline-5-carboxylate reductase [Actinospica durhamensis]
MRISLFGVGELGYALLGGWLAAGMPSSDIRGVERDERRAAQIEDTLDVRVVSALEAAEDADTAVLAVPAQSVPDLLAAIGPRLDPDCLVLSLAAGVPIELIERYLPAGMAVVRAMPNTAVSAREGMCVLSPGPDVDEGHLLRAEQLLRPVGEVIRVPEDQQNAATALSGSGPAFFYEVFDHMIRAGMRLGVTEEAAGLMAVQAAAGAVAMVRGTRRAPAHLREAVATPGGTTQAALAVLGEHGVGAAVEGAVRAAALRSAEVGDELWEQTRLVRE